MIALVVVAATAVACDRRSPPRSGDRGSGDARPAATPVATDWAAAARERMVADQLVARGVRNPRVLAAMREVPRHEFAPADGRDHAYEDHPIPIGYDQTMSQPYIVAVLAELAAPEPDDKVLEVGTGSGYTAAVLSRMAARVYTIEIVAPLAERAAATLARLGYDNVDVRSGDGYGGWPEAAPFDAIIVTAAPRDVPKPLLEQLAVGGRLVVPVGDAYQELRVITRTEDGFDQRTVFPVRFVPMQGRAAGAAAGEMRDGATGER